MPGFPEGYDHENLAQRTPRDVLDLHLRQFANFEFPGGFEDLMGCRLARCMASGRFCMDLTLSAFTGSHRVIDGTGCFQSLTNGTKRCKKHLRNKIRMNPLEFLLDSAV